MFVFPPMRCPLGPDERLLNRSIDDPVQSRMSRELSEMLGRLVDICTNVLGWCDESRNTSQGGVPLLLFRHVAELADAVSVLIAVSASEPTKPLLRGIMEAAFSIEYILGEPGGQRALAFRVARLHDDIDSLLRMDPSTREGKQHQAYLKADRGLDEAAVKPRSTTGEVAGIRAILAKAPLDAIEAEFQRMRKTIGRKPHWYSLFSGPTSIADMATKLKRRASYEFLYRLWSESIHGTGIGVGVGKTASGEPIYVPLRAPNRLATCSSFCLSMTWIAVNAMVHHYAPEKLGVVSHLYLRDLRFAYMRNAKRGDARLRYRFLGGLAGTESPAATVAASANVPGRRPPPNPEPGTANDLNQH